MSSNLESVATIDLIFELQKRQDFVGVIAYLKDATDDLIVSIIPQHVPDSLGAVMAKAILISAESP